MDWFICCIPGKARDYLYFKKAWSGRTAPGHLKDLLEIRQLGCSRSVRVYWLHSVLQSAGTALFATQAWWRPVVVAAALFCAFIFTFFWDGQVQALANKGLFAILINLAILIVLPVFR